MPINERIKQVRQTLDLTQGKFAERIAISTSYLAGMELGDKKVNDRAIRLISMEFGVSENWLRTGNGLMYDEASKVNAAKVISLFNSLSPRYQKCALTQMNALADLQSINKE